LETINNVLGMAALTGVSTFVAAGNSGSTTCERGSGVSGASLSFPAVSAFVTAVGGTRLTLGQGNARVGETVWNDTPYGQRAAGGGGVSKLVPRPDYQKQASSAANRAVPDVSALADISPGWPVVTDGTSGSSPLTAAATALVAGTERAPIDRRWAWSTAGSTPRPPIRAPSSTSSEATTTSPASAAAPRALVTTPRAGLACPTGRCCPAHCPQRPEPPRPHVINSMFWQIERQEGAVDQRPALRLAADGFAEESAPIRALDMICSTHTTIWVQRMHDATGTATGRDERRVNIRTAPEHLDHHQ